MTSAEGSRNGCLAGHHYPERYPKRAQIPTDVHTDVRKLLPDAGEIKQNLIVHLWSCTGTVSVAGPAGGEPTPRTFSFKGVSIAQVEGDKIASDHVYFDRKGKGADAPNVLRCGAVDGRIVEPRVDKDLSAAEMKRCRWLEPVLICQTRMIEMVQEKATLHQ